MSCNCLDNNDSGFTVVITDFVGGRCVFRRQMSMPGVSPPYISETESLTEPGSPWPQRPFGSTHPALELDIHAVRSAGKQSNTLEFEMGS